jgi:serine/threonine protein kinase
MCHVPAKEVEEKILISIREAPLIKTGDLQGLLTNLGICGFHGPQAMRNLQAKRSIVAQGHAPDTDPVACEAAQWSHPPDPSVADAGRPIGRGYLLRKVVGTGGHGVVYEALQSSLNRRVAIKVIPRERLLASGNPMALIKRLKREAEVLSRFNHPNIVHVIDAGGDADALGESPYIVMELIEAPTLQDLVESRGPLPFLQAALIFRDAARACEYARSKGVLHRDLKPSNILIEATGAKLLDFGLAQLFAEPGQTPPAQGESRITREGNVFLGTPMFQPTERHEGKGDERSDLYALAAVIYFALTGKHLFDFDKPPTFTDWAFAHYQADSRLVDIRHPGRRPDCPESLAGLLRRALRRDPASRYASYAELLRDLEPILTELKASQPPPAAAVPTVLAPEEARAPKSPAPPQGMSRILSDLERADGPQPAPTPSDPPGRASTQDGSILSGLRKRMAGVEERFGLEVGDVEVLHGQTGPLSVAILELARQKGLMPILQQIFETQSGLEVEAFEECLLAYAAGKSAILPSGTPSIPTGLGRYFYDADEIALNQEHQWYFPEAAVQYAEAIVVFLEGALGAPELVRHHKDAAGEESSKASRILTPTLSPPIPAVPPSAPAAEVAGSATPLLATGVQVGHYEIVRRLGGGGMGDVYLARDHRFGREVAIKILKSSFANDPAYLQRFERETRIAAQLNHPNIVPVYDTLTFQGCPCLVMAYVRGTDLASYLRQRGVLPAREALFIVRQVLDALAHAHRQGLVHRDIKPDNILILVEEGQDTAKLRVVLTDFGLMKSVRLKGLEAPPGSTHTQEGVFLGTPDYVSPEQALALPEVDSRTDLWALGVVLYEMLSGARPYVAPTLPALLFKIADAHTEPVPLGSLKPDLDPRIVRLVERCLRKKPEERWLRAQDLRDEIDQILAGASSLERESGAVRNVRRRVGALATLGLAALGVLIWSFFGPGNQAPSPKGAFELPHRSDTARRDEAKTAPALEEPRKPVEIGKPEPEKIAAPPKTEEKPAPKVEPPTPRLREKFAAQRPGPRAAALMADLMSLFEKRQSDLRFASYDGLVEDLDAFDKGLLHGDGALAAPSDDYVASHSKAARRMLALARQAVQARLERLRTSKGKVVLKTAQGGTVSGQVQDLDQAKISLRDDQGGTITVELSKLALEEFVPGAGAPAAELAFGGLTLHPARTLGQVLDFEENDESVLLWVPFLVRLARLEVRGQARDTALEAKDLLPKTQAVDDQVAVLVHHVAFEAAESGLLKEKPRVLPVYGYLDPDFSEAQREKESLELLLHRRYSQVVASYRDTASGPVAGELLLLAFEKDLEAGSEELFAGSGWYNNRWDIWPEEPDVKKRQKLFDTRNPKAIVLRDPAGPRSMIMNDDATRAPEGILLRLSFEPEPGRSETAYWSFLLRGGKGRTDNLILRVDAAGIGLYRPVLEPGAKDACLARAPLPPATGEDPFRAYALVPGEEHLHVFVDRESVLSLPVENARIPNQLAFTVCYGQGTVRCMLARKPLPAAADGGKKKKDTDK